MLACPTLSSPAYLDGFPLIDSHGTLYIRFLHFDTNLRYVSDVQIYVTGYRSSHVLFQYVPFGVQSGFTEV